MKKTKSHEEKRAALVEKAMEYGLSVSGFTDQALEDAVAKHEMTFATAVEDVVGKVTSEAPPEPASPDPGPQPEKTLQDKERDIRHVLTDGEANLLMLAANEEADWSKYARVIDDYELMKDPFSLPPECAVREEKKEFRYRWLDPKDTERFERQLDKSAKIRWWLVTRNTAKYLPGHYFDASGLVRRSGLVLAKMPYDMYLMRQQMVWKLADYSWKDHENRIGPGPAEGVEFTGRSGGRFRGGDIRTAQAVLDESGNESFTLGDVRLSAGEASDAE